MYLHLTIDHTREVLAQAEEDMIREVKNLAEAHADFRNQVAPVLATLQALPSWADVVALDSNSGYLSLTLHKDRKDSPLPREIAQAFHAKGIKRATGAHGLQVDFTLAAVYLCVSNYLPATCRVETVEEWIPAHHGAVQKVVCTGGPDAGVEGGGDPF